MRLKRSLCAALMISILGSATFSTAKDVQNSKQSRKELAMSTAPRLSKTSKIPKTKEKSRPAPAVEKYLLEGRLADGEADLSSKLKNNPGDDQTRFELGILQFLRAIESLSQDLYKNGIRDLASRDGLGSDLMLFRLPVPNNPEPETLTYPKARNIVETFRANLMRAENTMASIKDSNLKVPLHFGLIRLDLNADRHADFTESLWKVYASITQNTRIKEEQAEKFYVCFDRGDVHWLRGYCHLISSLCEIYLAHDTKDTFERTAHLLFKKVQSPYPFLNEGVHFRTFGSEDLEILDLVALIHLISWDVVEPKRMESALHHLEEVVAQSKISWKYIMAETDNDREWLPNPQQDGVIPNVRVTAEMVSSWDSIMTKCGRVLSGELLITFWRGREGRGVNLRKAFLEPRKLDLVLWVQGTAAAPYLQYGQRATGWTELADSFGNNFPGFAAYFN